MSLDVRSYTSRMLVGNLDMGLLLVMRPNPQTFQKTSAKLVNEQLTNSGWVITHWGNQLDTITVSGVTASKVGNPDQYKKDDFLTSSIKNLDIASKTKSYLLGNDETHGPKQWANVDRFILKLEQIYKTDKERTGRLADLVKGNHLTTAIVSSLGSFSLFAKGGKDSLSSFAKNRNADRSELLKSIREGYAARAQSFIIYNYCIYWGYFTSFSYNESATDKPRQFQYSFTFKVVNSSTDWLSQSLISNFPEARVLNLFSQIKDVGSYAASMTTSGDKLLKGIFI